MKTIINAQKILPDPKELSKRILEIFTREHQKEIKEVSELIQERANKGRWHVHWTHPESWLEEFRKPQCMILFLRSRGYEARESGEQEILIEWNLKL